MSLTQRSATDTPLMSPSEEDCSLQHLRVRRTLLAMPARRCAVGFEFRLQKKLESGESALRRPVRATNWSLGWMGAGVGFAAALAVAVIAFDFNGGPPTGLQVAGNPVQTAPVVTSGAIPQTVSQPSGGVQQHSITTSPVTTEGNVADAKAAGSSDSLSKLKDNPQGEFPAAQTVSGKGK